MTASLNPYLLAMALVNMPGLAQTALLSGFGHDDCEGECPAATTLGSVSNFKQTPREGKYLGSSDRSSSGCDNDVDFDPCIDASIIQGYCTCDDSTHTITVPRGEQISPGQPDVYYLKYCLDRFAAATYFRYSKLVVQGFDDLELIGDTLGGMKFDEVEFNDCKINQVDDIFLATTRDFAKHLKMHSIVSNTIPNIEARCLQTLDLKFESTDDFKLRSRDLQTIPLVQSLTVESNRTIHVGRNAFRHLMQLEELSLKMSVELTFGSLSFERISKIKKISILQLDKATAGSIGVMPGCDFIVNINQEGWSPSVWFNFLSFGGSVSSIYGSLDCNACELAYLRRGFAGAVDIKCTLHGVPADLTNISLEDFAHCP